MHRPRTALLVAVAVAAACLSSPPALRADSSHGKGPFNGGPPPTISPYGDSDQYTTKTPPPPTTSHSTDPYTPEVGQSGGGGNGGGAGGGGRFACDGSRVGVRNVAILSQLLRSFLQAFLGFVEQ